MPYTRIQYLCALLFAPFSVGIAFKGQLPLHVTLMPWFEFQDVPISDDAFMRQLAHMCAGRRPIEVIGSERDMLGDDNSIPATRIACDTLSPLRALHSDLWMLMCQGSATLHTRPDWIGAGYTPHVTDRRNLMLPVSESVIAYELTLFRKVACKNPRKKLYARFPFGA